jgi:hypothetical protein
MVTSVPTAPVFGERLVTVGTAPVTVKVIALLVIPLEVVITTGPEDAPAGTGTTTLLVIQLVGVAAIP